MAVDWSQFTPLDSDSGATARTQPDTQAVDWSRFTPVEEKPHSTIGDIGRSAAGAAEQGGGEVLQGIGDVLGKIDKAVPSFERYTQEHPESRAENLVEFGKRIQQAGVRRQRNVSPEFAEATSKGLTEPGGLNPTNIASKAVNTVAAMGAPLAVSLIPGVGPVVGAGLGMLTFGAQGEAAGRNAGEQEASALSDADLAKLPEYQNYLKQGMSQAQAREAFIQHAADTQAISHGVPAALLGVAGRIPGVEALGEGAARKIVRGIGRTAGPGAAMASRGAARVVGKGIGEGVGFAGINTAGQVTSNVTNPVPTKPLEGVGEAAASGLLPGFVLGAGRAGIARVVSHGPLGRAAQTARKTGAAAPEVPAEAPPAEGQATPVAAARPAQGTAEGTVTGSKDRRAAAVAYANQLMRAADDQTKTPEERQQFQAEANDWVRRVVAGEFEPAATPEQAAAVQAVRQWPRPDWMDTSTGEWRHPTDDEVKAQLHVIADTGNNLSPRLLSRLWHIEPERVTSLSEQVQADRRKGVTTQDAFDQAEATRPAENLQQESADQAANAQGVPFMITNSMRAALAERGYDRDAIARMTPQEAHSVLAGAPPNVPTSKARRVARKQHASKPETGVPRGTMETLVGGTETPTQEIATPPGVDAVVGEDRKPAVPTEPEIGSAVPTPGEIPPAPSPSGGERQAPSAHASEPVGQGGEVVQGASSEPSTGVTEAEATQSIAKKQGADTDNTTLTTSPRKEIFDAEPGDRVPGGTLAGTHVRMKDATAAAARSDTVTVVPWTNRAGKRRWSVVDTGRPVLGSWKRSGKNAWAGQSGAGRYHADVVKMADGTYQARVHDTHGDGDGVAVVVADGAPGEGFQTVAARALRQITTPTDTPRKRGGTVTPVSDRDLQTQVAGEAAPRAEPTRTEELATFKDTKSGDLFLDVPPEQRAEVAERMKALGIKFKPRSAGFRVPKKQAAEAREIVPTRIEHYPNGRIEVMGNGDHVADDGSTITRAPTRDKALQALAREQPTARKVPTAAVEGAARTSAVHTARTQMRAAKTFSEARKQAAQNIVGKELTNDNGAVPATLSRTTLEKMLSASATRKSVSAGEHARAVANIDHLYKIGHPAESHPDKKGEPTITAIHRVVAPMAGLDGRPLTVRMTVKETRSAKNPNPLYSVEAIDVTKPALEAPQSGIERAPGRDRNTPQAGFVTKSTTKRSGPPKESSAEPAEIKDFGEKLGGARKDYVPSVDKDLADNEIAKLPLSKIWPASDVEAITDPFAAAVAHAARAEVPAKPRSSWKLRRWVEQVQNVRKLARMAAHGELTPDDLTSKSALHDFAAKVKLLQHIDRSQWNRIGNVSEAPNAFSYGPNSQRIPRPHVSVSIDGRWQRFDGAKSIDDVMDAVKARLQETAPTKAKLQFEIRGNRRTGEYFINKKGDSEYRHLKDFKSVDEARDYLRGHYSDLVSAWEGVKARDNVTKADMRNAENRERKGPDYRDGKDVTPEQFSEAFGFRGVEFGNWVKQGKNAKERQGLLNQAYDGLMDLANILHLPPRAMSLDGTLGLGLGSRGHGWASAHFEPGNLVINLTKTRGAGALAHEWFHALDNYFARTRAEPKFTGNQGAFRRAAYVTYRPEPMMVSPGAGHMLRAELMRRHARFPKAKLYDPANWKPDPNHPAGVRPVVEKAFADLVTALNESPMRKRAESIDKGKTDGYWSRIIERAARSFENYVIARMDAEGITNDYLANVRQLEQFNRNPARYPYLRPEEVKPVADAFDNLFTTIETREGENGNVKLFSRRGWNGFPDAIVAHRPGVVRENPDYTAAKGGDDAAALRLAKDVVTPEFVESVRAAIPSGSKPTIVPVLAVESAGKNRIPLAAANVLGERLGLPVDENIVQSRKVSRGGSGAMHRVAVQPTFSGEVKPGDYIILDDTLTQGGTLAQLKTHIEDNGGRVVLATALTGKNYSRKLAIDPGTLDDVRERFGSIENWWRKTFGHGFDGLTQSEARAILAYKPRLRPDQLRNLVAKARDESLVGVDEGATGRGAQSRPLTPLAEALHGLLARSKVQEIVDRATAKWGDGQPRVRVVEDAEGLPASAKRGGDDYKTAEGYYDPATSTAYLVASNLRSPRRVREVLAHEAIGHHGVENVVNDAFGRDGWQKVEDGIVRLDRSGTASDAMKKVLAETHRRYAGADASTFAKEFLAVSAEKGVRNAFLDRVVTAIRRYLRKIMPDLAVSERELRQLLVRGERHVREGTPYRERVAQKAALAFSGKPDTFYSALAESVARAKGAPKKADAAAWKQWLDGAQRRGEFKGAEREWMDLDGWLDQQKGPISRQALIDHVRQHQVRVQEVMHADEVTPESARGIVEDEDGNFVLEGGEGEQAGSTRYGEYTLPGGKNYRELLITLPGTDAETLRRAAKRRLEIRDALDDIPIGDEARGDALQAEAERLQQQERGAFQSQHFDEPNIVAHVRMNDRIGPNGEKILHVEEVQSDWHQAGRRRGYGADDDQAARARITEISHRLDVLRNQPAARVGREEQELWAERARLYHKVKDTVPDAPFKKEWPMLAMKRVLRYAAEHGYDKVTWTTGKQQAERYDLSKRISKLIYIPDHDGGVLFAYGKDGNQVLREKNVKPEGIEDYVGKEAARKLLDAPPDPREPNVRTLSGVDLRMGGEGMTAFYDRMLPNEIGKYVKKWGGKVGETTVETRAPRSVRNEMDLTDLGEPPPADNSTRRESTETATLHSIDITPAMRESVLQGQPLFARQVDEGPHGPVYEANDFKSAVDTLLRAKKGEVRGALFNAKSGPVDLVYGKPGTAAEKFKDGYGLAKILAKHPEVDLYALADDLLGAKATPPHGNTWQFEGDKYRMVLKRDWLGDKKTWLLTAFGPREESATGRTRIDVATNERGATTRAPQAADVKNATPAGAQVKPKPSFSRPEPRAEKPADPSREPRRALDAEANVLREGDPGTLKRVREWLSGKKEDVRPFLLGALQANHLIELMRDKDPFKHTVTRYQRSMDQLDADRNILVSGAPDAAEHPTDMLKKGAVPIAAELQKFAYGSSWKMVGGKFTPEAKRTFDVMHGATIAGVDPERPYERLTVQNARGDHVAWTRENRAERLNMLRKLALQRGGDSWADRERLADERRYLRALPRLEREREVNYTRLKKQFDALPEEGKRIYRETRDWYARYSEETEKALIKNIEAMNVPETYRRSLVQRMRAQFEAARREGVYFPLNRNGDYWIAYRTTEGRNGFEMFERFNDARRRERVLKAKGYRIDATGRRDQNAKAKDAPSGTFVREIIDTLANAKVSEQVQDQVYQAYLQMLPSLSMRKHAIHRGNVVGYDHNVPRTFAKFSFHGAYQLAKLRHAQDMQFALEAMGKSLDNWRRGPDRFPGANAHELEKFMESALARFDANPEGEQVAATKVEAGGLALALDTLAERVASNRRGPGAKVEREAWEGLAQRWRDLPKDVRRAYTLEAAERFGLHAPKSSQYIAKMDALLGELRKRHDWIMNPTDQQVANMVNSIGFIYYLGASPASALTNLTQTVQTTLPYLGARHGWDRAARMLWAAWRDAARTGGNMERLLKREDERRAFIEMQQRGIFSRTQAHTLAGLAEGNVLQANPAWARIMNGISWMFHRSELVNRQAAGMAAYRLARAEGRNFDDALEYAAEVNKATNFDYSAANRQRWAQGNVPRITLQFKNYSANMTWMFWRNFYQAFKAETPEVRRVARRTLTGMLGMTALLAGATGLPVYSIVRMTANAANTVWGDPDQPFSFDDEFHRWLADNLGPNAARLIAEGPTNYLTGANLASRTSMANLWIHDNDQRLEGADAYHALLETLAGPAGNILNNYYVGSEDIRRGHYWRGVERMLPTAVKNAMKALRYAHEGVNTMRGDPIVPDVSGYEDFLQAIGFQPARVANQYRINTAMRNFTSEVQDRRRDLMNAYALALKSSDADDRAGAVRAINRFNRAHPQVPITTKTLASSLRQRARLSTLARHGVILNRNLAMQAQQYAGVQATR